METFALHFAFLELKISLIRKLMTVTKAYFNQAGARGCFHTVLICFVMNVSI